MITKVSLRLTRGPGCQLEVSISKVVLLAAALFAALVFAGPLPAQTGNAQLDNNPHPNAGALLAKRPDSSLFIACSGTLVSKRVFLTAGHCADFLFSIGQFDAFVTFDPNFGLDPGHDIFSTPYHGAPDRVWAIPVGRRFSGTFWSRSLRPETRRATRWA
jgi:hypothetical protein